MRLPKEYKDYIIPKGELQRLLRGHTRRKDDFDHFEVEHSGGVGGSPPTLVVRRVGRRLELSRFDSDEVIKVWPLSADKQRDSEGFFARRVC